MTGGKRGALDACLENCFAALAGFKRLRTLCEVAERDACCTGKGCGRMCTPRATRGRGQYQRQGARTARNSRAGRPTRRCTSSNCVHQRIVFLSGAAPRLDPVRAGQVLPNRLRPTPVPTPTPRPHTPAAQRSAVARECLA